MGSYFPNFEIKAFRFKNFDDRVVLKNPGSLVFGQTLEGVKSGISKPKNKAIVRIMRGIGKIEDLGSSINRMMNLCLKHNKHPPVLLKMVCLSL